MTKVHNCSSVVPPLMISQFFLQVVQLIDELAAAGSKELEVVLDPEVPQRLCAYARSVAHFPTAVKEFEWRTGFFYDLSKRALTGGKADPCPLHTAWLKKVGAV